MRVGPRPGRSEAGIVDTPSLDNPDLYLNRELSQLAFNRRVFEQARDPATPLLERLRFLCISCSNLDEFFEVRVAGLLHQIEYGAVHGNADGLTPGEALSRISADAHALVADQYELLNRTILPALEREGLRFLRRGEWSDAQDAWITRYFSEQLLPIVSPIRLDPAHPFPSILNKSLNFIVSLKGEDAFGHAGGMAVVQAPRPLPRLIRLPPEVSEGRNDFVFLSSVIHARVGDLFPGMEITGCYQFRVTRNSDLFVDAEDVDDLMRALVGELPSRRYGAEVRLEVADNCPGEMVGYLMRRFGLSEQMVFRVNGPVNLHRLMALPDLVDRPDLKYPPFTPGLPARMGQPARIFETIAAGDVLLHHPFQSFTPVIDFVRQAAADPDVLAIKQTLYRTGAESSLVDALVAAARAGKEVTVCVELRARFDEEANISLAETLQEAGAHVVYGVVGYKTHAKMLLVVRREGERLRRYVHLGTGNYHARTTRVYTDFGLLTADPQIGQDVHEVFMQLTGLGRASQAGVEIDLIVRGACGLRPGIPGVSDHIRVRSIVGRFLEHTRVFHFENDGDPRLFCASADWMNRNLFQRVETCFPILDPVLRERVIEEGLMPYLDDNTHAWRLDADGAYHRTGHGDGPAVSSQQQLLERLGGESPGPASGGSAPVAAGTAKT